MDKRIRDRMECNYRDRIDALAFDVADRGFVAAEEYARKTMDGTGEAGADINRRCAVALAELDPDNADLQHWLVDGRLREHCSEAIAQGRTLSEPLRAFAANALLTAPQTRGRGKPAVVPGLTREVAIQIMRDLRDAGVPVYHGDGQDSDAEFYATDAVVSALADQGLDVAERTVREWWQKRSV